MRSLNVQVFTKYAASMGTALNLLEDSASLVLSQGKWLLFMAQFVCLFLFCTSSSQC